MYDSINSQTNDNNKNNNVDSYKQHVKEGDVMIRTALYTTLSLVMNDVNFVILNDNDEEEHYNEYHHCSDTNFKVCYDNDNNSSDGWSALSLLSTRVLIITISIGNVSKRVDIKVSLNCILNNDKHDYRNEIIIITEV